MRRALGPRVLVTGLFVALVLVATVAGRSAGGNDGGDGGGPVALAGEPAVLAAQDTAALPVVADPVVIDPVPRVPQVPHGGTKVFDGRVLVAYYGTAGTGSLGVLGETDPDTAIRRVRKAAQPFRRGGRPAVPVFELIVTVADRAAGKDRDFSHDIDRAAVRRYIRAAEKHHVMLVLDLQPGRSDFLKVARRWAWALEHPNVGLALDPEWRMGRKEVPGHRIGSVRAAEVNRVSRWLEGLVRRENLPQKIFMLHQFRREMIPDISRIQPRKHLAMVQHVDGFGTPGQKLATYHHVARPKQFHMGFKLFYDEDVRRMSAARVKRIDPRVDFVSFQ